jgi:hypothetical protein
MKPTGARKKEEQKLRRKGKEKKGRAIKKPNRKGVAIKKTKHAKCVKG